MPKSRIHKNIPKPTRKVRGGMDYQHLRNVGNLPCLICGNAATTHAHHLLRTGERGMNMKSPDKWAVPLCHLHHSCLHAHGDEEAYLTEQGIDGRSVARALWANKEDIEAMWRIAFRAWQAGARTRNRT